MPADNEGRRSNAGWMPAHPEPFLTHFRIYGLRGANLRYSLLTVLHQQASTMSIAELIEALETMGLTVGGPVPNKTVSDVLRSELRNGRVRRVRRGHYASLPRPDTTTRRHRDRLRRLVEDARGQHRP